MATIAIPTAHPWQNLSISATARNALNSALMGHERWPEIRTKYACNMATLVRDERLAICHELGIDVPTIVASVNAETPPGDTATATPAPAPVKVEFTPAPAGDAMANLASAIAAIAGQQINPDQIGAIVESKIASALAKVPSIRIEVQAGDSVNVLEGHNHATLPTLVKAAASRGSDGFHPNIWLSGPTGSGKTHAAKQVAKALGLEFSFHGAMGMSHELMGYCDANGNYHATEFRRIFEGGGVILLDECDAWDSNATLALNAALANGLASFPDKLVKRHPDCVVIAAGNTWGSGATADYVGRAKIDAAFMSRFPVKIAWDYDIHLETMLSGNEPWAKRVINARMKAREKGLKVVIDPRQTYAGAALIANGFTPDEAAKLTYLAALTTEQRNMIGN